MKFHLFLRHRLGMIQLHPVSIVTGLLLTAYMMSMSLARSPQQTMKNVETYLLRMRRTNTATSVMYKVSNCGLSCFVMLSCFLF